MKYKAALIDMNGVITDDEVLHELAFTKVLSKHGYELDHAGYIKHFAGKTDEAGFKSFFGQNTISTSGFQAIGQEKTSAYKKLANNKLKSYPGIIKYIHALYDNGIRLALVTSSTRIEAKTVVEVFQLTKFFACILTANEVRESKPSPQGYLMAVDILGLTPDDCFIVEDTPSGVAAANAAKINCLAVTNTHSFHELKNAQLVVDKLGSKLIFP